MGAIHKRIKYCTMWLRFASSIVDTAGSLSSVRDHFAMSRVLVVVPVLCQKGIQKSRYIIQYGVLS
jgi:hypothetical protein